MKYLYIYGAKYTIALNIPSGIRLEMVKTTSVAYANATSKNISMEYDNTKHLVWQSFQRKFHLREKIKGKFG